MGFWNSPINLGKKIVNKATNSKVAKAVPGGKSIGKSIRNIPGLKVSQPPKPVTGGLAPSEGLQAKQLPMMQEPVGMDVPMQRPTVPEPAPAPLPTPMDNNIGMGEAMGQPAVMPRTPEPDMNSGLGPSPNQNQFAAMAQRMAPVMNRYQQRRAMRRF